MNGSTAIEGFRPCRSRNRGDAPVARRGVDRARRRKTRIGTLDVLQRLLAGVLEGEVEPVADMIAHRCRDADAARLGDALQARRHIDAVAENVAVLDDDVAEIDADAELDAAVLRHVGVAAGHAALDFGGAGDSVHHAREFHQHAVAGQLDDAALVLGDLAVDQFLAMRLERGKRGGLVDAHQPAIADHVGRQYGGEPSVGVLVSHWHRLFPQGTACPKSY